MSSINSYIFLLKLWWLINSTSMNESKEIDIQIYVFSQRKHYESSGVMLKLAHMPFTHYSLSILPIAAK